MSQNDTAMSQNDTAMSLADLTDRELAYVKCRADTVSEAEALRKAGIVRRTFYRWPEERRKQLLEIAQKFKRSVAAHALQMLEDSLTEAAEVKLKGLRSRKEHIAQAAADSILDRVLGKPTQRVKQEIIADQVIELVGPDEYEPKRESSPVTPDTEAGVE